MRPSIWTRQFWKAAAERGISTAAQAAIAAIGTSALPAVSLPWPAVGAAAGLAGLLSVLKSLVVNQVTRDGPGMTDAETVVEHDAL